MDRRTLLILAGAVLATPPAPAQSNLRKSGTGEMSGPHFFSPGDYEVVDTLAEMIIPADDHSPGAHEAGVAKYIDMVVANSAKDVQAAWRKGLAAFADTVGPHAAGGFVSAAPGLRTELVTRMMEQSDDAGSSARTFVMTVREMTIFGYYSTEIGLLKELQYKGNQVMAMFPGCKA